MTNGLDAVVEMGPTDAPDRSNREHGTLPDPTTSPDGGHDDRGATLSLLFHEGERPGAEAVAAVIAESRASGLPARVSHRPAGEEWVELLASGLTFDLTGLVPGQPSLPPRVDHPFGFGPFGLGEALPAGLDEAIELVPSGHIVAGAALQPILRTMMGLAANLAIGLPVRAVAWGPARTVMEPRYFTRMVLNWLAGGAFPVLGLTALLRGADGSVASRGLAHFTGQEMQLEAREGESPADTAKLAVRVIDHLVREGRIAAPVRIGTGADALLLEPSQVGRLVLVWREG
jgi:hypothetical protein